MNAKKIVEIKCGKKGYVSEIQSEGIGRLLIALGGGRNQVGAPIDHSVGFFFHKKLGSLVRAEDTLVTIFGNEKTDFNWIESQVHSMIKITTTKKVAPKLILEANVK
jgi:pyrimidine-nucleoside phosphorylase